MVRISASLTTAAAALLLTSAAAAQPFNVRAWYAQGQVFVVWQFPAPPAVPTDTVEIYASAAAQPDVALMTRVGRLFYPEYTGSRLTALLPNARLTLPTPGGGLYTLAADEGAFAYTPHAAGALFFAVVDTGSTAVVAANSDATNFLYDPVNDPIRPHPQGSGVTPGGNPFTMYVLWADGRPDPNDGRPDFPVMGAADKNGVPHVFVISKPHPNLPPPTAALSCLFALHGGEGEYQLFLPGEPARANMSLPLDDGIVVTPDDSLFFNLEGVMERSNTSWFGYIPDFDPFTDLPRPTPADTAIVVNYTQRRVHWILDWLLQPVAPHEIDPTRVAMVGHSGGGRGTSHLTRLRPERFSGVVVYTPASNLTLDDTGKDNFLRGDWDQNLDTNLPAPGGGVLGFTDVVTMTTRLSLTQRDFALTRFFYGKRDEKDAAAWSEAQRAVMDALNDSRAGYMIFWDEREHGVEKWDNETNDAFDPHAGPWPDVGQWIAPERTYRAAGQYLVDAYRANQSYPGFFNADFDPNLPGLQLDPGPGDPDLGDAWGTWGGYFDWDTATLSETEQHWECTLFVVGLSTVAIDNSPVAQILTDFAPRKTQHFNPPAGMRMRWSAVDVSSGVEVQSGCSVAESDGVVVVTGLSVPRDPDRIHVTISSCPADLDCDGDTDQSDLNVLLASFATDAGGDLDGDGDTDQSDLNVLLANFGSACN